jgi:fucose 4-O-acetylase-like acetyltransferase
MPLFFITAGYFFSSKYLATQNKFIAKRFKGLYIPFIKWSIFFLLIHNILFQLNIINDQYGNGSPGGVAHAYTWHQLQQYIWQCVTQMGGYDVFLTGAFWFFRALLVASILYFFLFKFLFNSRLFIGNTERVRNNIIGGIICVFILLLAAWKTYSNISIYTFPMGGYRELMGTFFFGIGFLFRQNENLLKQSIWSLIGSFIVVALFSRFAGASMAWNSTFYKFLSLPVPAICGFVMTYQISGYINRHDNLLKRFMVYCGDNTLPIYIFHTISFKLVSLIKIAYYGLSFKQIGCHMVIHDYAHEDLFWIVYSIVGVGVPLIVHYWYKKIKIARCENRN